MDTPENHARLADIRGQELAEALRRLGGVESRLLGYEDSGMMGTPENDDPASFWQADLDEAIGRTVRVVRDVQPDVIVGYNDFGGYGHPDHIRAAQDGQGRLRAGWRPRCLPRAPRRGPRRPGSPRSSTRQCSRLSGRERLRERVAERGIKAWWLPDEDATEEQRAESAAFMERMTRRERAGHDPRRREWLHGRQARRHRGPRDPDRARRPLPWR